MSTVETEFVAPPTLAERVALVQAQLAPIRSRRALMDSYQRESLYRLATTVLTSGSETDVLDLAYAVRYMELENETPSPELLLGFTDGMVDE